jgi:hypothetical protein
VEASLDGPAGRLDAAEEAIADERPPGGEDEPGGIGIVTVSGLDWCLEASKLFGVHPVLLDRRRWWVWSQDACPIIPSVAWPSTGSPAGARAPAAKVATLDLLLTWSGDRARLQ